MRPESMPIVVRLVAYGPRTNPPNPAMQGPLRSGHSPTASRPLIANVRFHKGGQLCSHEKNLNFVSWSSKLST